MEAQSKFRSQDLDRNGRPNFWRSDVAGLYGLAPSGQPLCLIDLSIAGADSASVTKIGDFVTKGPCRGYWFRAIPFSGEAIPDPDRFAVLACPDSRAYGRLILEWRGAKGWRG